MNIGRDKKSLPFSIAPTNNLKGKARQKPVLHVLERFIHLYSLLFFSIGKSTIIISFRQIFLVFSCIFFVNKIIIRIFADK